jgi:hypothetical protein
MDILSSPPISILLYTHKRADYLKLSLNSLLFSLDGDLEDITIFMSNPSPDVEYLVCDFSEKYPNIEVFKSEENIACAAINAYLQIKNPEKFIIFEEDYILPQHTKFVLPHWRRQFSQLLDEFDIVNFQTSIENQPHDFSYNTSKRNTPFSFTHEWITDKSLDIHITGNGFAVKSAFYKSFSNNPPFYISGDGHVFTQAKKVCASSIHGYHIGWNQEMDGHVKIGDKSRFPEPGPIQTIINCKTQEKHTIDLRSIMPITRVDIINYLISLTKAESYLEIGSGYHVCFKDINCTLKHDIEPDPGPGVVPTYKMSSNEAFAIMEDVKYDIIFIDGKHHCEQVAIDVNNSIKHLTPNGFIIIHDCLPENESEQVREPYGGSWTGDVWKFQAWMVGHFNDAWTITENWGCGIIWGGMNFEVPLLEELSVYNWGQFEVNWPWMLRTVSWESFKKIISIRYNNFLNWRDKK